MNEHFKNVHIIGAGGVASYFLAPFLRTFKPEQVSLWDGDELEKRNLERQNFDSEDVGQNKAKALISRTILAVEDCPKINCINHYFTETETLKEDPSLIFVFADNHPARSNVLAYVDRVFIEKGITIPVIIGANELVSSEAYVYFPDWPISNHLDPRARYPEIDVIKDDDPTKGCIEASKKVTQLAMSNYMAAGFSMRLAWAWLVQTVSDEDRKYLPIELSDNPFANRAETYEQHQGEQ